MGIGDTEALRFAIEALGPGGRRDLRAKIRAGRREAVAAWQRLRPFLALAEAGKMEQLPNGGELYAAIVADLKLVLGFVEAASDALAELLGAAEIVRAEAAGAMTSAEPIAAQAARVTATWRTTCRVARARRSAPPSPRARMVRAPRRPRGHRRAVRLSAQVAAGSGADGPPPEPPPTRSVAALDRARVIVEPRPAFVPGALAGVRHLGEGGAPV